MQVSFKTAKIQGRIVVLLVLSGKKFDKEQRKRIPYSKYVLSELGLTRSVGNSEVVSCVRGAFSQSSNESDTND